jgi:hypothetical protein
VNVRRFVRLLVLVLFFALAPLAAFAQDFGVMNSAETINPGNVKLSAAPLFTFGEGDDDVGLSLGGGYGLTSTIDVEGRFAIFDDVKYVGVDAELWFLKRPAINLSATIGYHAGLGDVIDTRGVDVTAIGSRLVRPRLEIFGAIDLAFNTIDDARGDDDFTTAHLVPGVEYALRPDLDFVAELGIGLTDDSSNYVSAGIAFYIR